MAFTFGLVEFAEYRSINQAGAAQRIIHPRVLAQTVTVERHVIRSEVPGVTIEAVTSFERVPTLTHSRSPSDAGVEWKKFVERLIAELRFDDPGQPPPRNGGMGWLRVPLPEGFYVNVHRSSGEGGLGAQIRFTGPEGAAFYSELCADRQAIAGEFVAAGLEAPQWRDDDSAGSVFLTHGSPPPWDDAAEAMQWAWACQ